MSASPQISMRMGRGEFIALIAMMFATIAFSMDAMLPALPEIGAELSPDAPARAGLILTSFVLGMGIGTFMAGPLSDAYGRRNIIFIGSGIYVVASAVAWASSTLEIVLIARVVQGIGAAGPRVVSLAIIRDLFSGREMARIMSLAMLIFTLFPAVAPLLGAAIIDSYGWRSIFVAFILFSLATQLWMGARLDETLAVDARRPMRISLMADAVRQMFAHPMVRLSIIVQTLALSQLFVTLMLVQPVFEQIYDRAESFPLWFAVVALVSGTGSIVNAVLVVRLGMRLLITVTLGVQILLSGAMVLFDLGGLGGNLGFYAFLIWQTCLFFQAGLTLGNLNALAMEPMGHIAGMAASVIGGVSTVMAAAIASPVGLLFDGTLWSLPLSVLCMATFAFLLMLRMHRRDMQVAE